MNRAGICGIQPASNLWSELDDDEESDDDTDAEATVIQEVGVGGRTMRSARCISIKPQAAQAETDTEIIQEGDDIAVKKQGWSILVWSCGGC